MENGGLPLLATVLIIVAIPVFVGLLAYAAMGGLRKQAHNLAQQIDATLLDLTQRHDQLSGFLQNYRGIDREPFFTHLDALQTESREIDGLLTTQLEEFRVFVKDLHDQQYATTPLQMVLAPMTQFRLWRRARKQRAAGKRMTEQIDAAEKRVQIIAELPWDLALECRKADEETAELEQILQWLQAKNVRGAALQKVSSQLPFLQQGLAKIPDLLFDADKDTLLKTARLDLSIKAIDALQAVRPALDRYLPQVRTWRASLEKLSQEYADLKNTGARLRQTMATPPTGLAVTGLQSRLDQVAQRAAEIQQQMNQPEADALKGLAREIHLLRQTLRATEQQFQAATTQLNELQTGLGELHSLLDATSAQRAATERSDSYPLIWDQSSAEIDALRKDIDALGSIRQQRTPEQIIEQRKTIKDLRARLKAVAEQTPKTIAQYQALVQLLTSSDLQEGGPWLRKTRALLDQAANFDSKNWQKSESVVTLPAEIEALAQNQERLVPVNRTYALKESALEPRLAETKILVQQHKSLRARVEAVNARLNRLQALQAESKEYLDAGFTILDRVLLLSDSNALLRDLAEGEAEHLMGELRQTINDVNAHSQGEIERKTGRSQAFLRKVRASLDRWLEQLSVAMNNLYLQVDAQLTELDSIVRLESRPVDDARGFLNQAGADLQRGAGSPAQGVMGKVAGRFQHADAKTTQTDLEALGALKQKNDLWLTLLSHQEAIESQIQPVMDAYTAAAQARDEAQDLLREAQKRYPGERTWPPANQPPISQTSIFGAVDEKWAGLRQKRVQPDWAVQELQRIGQQYELARERIQHAVERIEDDQKRIRDQELEVEMLKQHWLNQSDPVKPVLREGVKKIISETDSRLASIRQKSLAGEASYEQSLQSLRDLYDYVISREITVDENTKIGLKDTPRRRPEKA